MRIHHPLRVAVVFGPGRTIKPIWFDWNNRKHAILETTYTWTDLKGSARRLHFAVRDEGGLYQLTYDTSDQSWSLEGIETES